MRHKLGWMPLFVVLVLLAACGQTAAPQQPIALGAQAAAPLQACNLSGQSATRIGDLEVVISRMFTIFFRKLPAGIPLAPYQIPNPDDTAALDARIPVQPLVFPLPASEFPGYIVDICNASTTASHSIQGGIVKITTFVPFTGRINTWTICDGYFTRSVPFSQTSGGCGGSARFDEQLRATFPPGAGAGSQVTAEFVGVGAAGFGPLPVNLAPGKQITLWFQLNAPQVPGTYAHALSLTVDHTQLAFLPAESPVLFALVAHKFTGAACQSQPMNQQIPLATTPPTYYICPEGVTGLPTAAPGRG